MILKEEQRVNNVRNAVQLNNQSINNSFDRSITDLFLWLCISATLSHGETGIRFEIERLGIKDAGYYAKPYIHVIVASTSGEIIEELSTDQSIKQSIEPPYVAFGQTVNLSTSLQQLIKNNLTVFFEFNHFKKSKNKISTRCWAMLEHNEIERAASDNHSDDTVNLELYQKPTNFTKNKVKLFTIKPLYLQLRMKLYQG